MVLIKTNFNERLFMKKKGFYTGKAGADDDGGGGGGGGGGLADGRAIVCFIIGY
jgi:hypothetical protein